VAAHPKRCLEVIDESAPEVGVSLGELDDPIELSTTSR
jgi:hypothetical protein